MDFSKIILGCKLYPKSSVWLEYGTSGFRAKATLLDHVAFKVGILAALRSMATGKVVGLMVTASHNPEDDNGVKLIDPDGGMLDFGWEAPATDLVNTDTDRIANEITTIIATKAIDITRTGTVLFGWDTRPSSIRLVAIASEGVRSINAQPLKTNLCTTPLLHYLVRCENDPEYGEASERGYYDKLLTAFDSLWILANTNDYGNYVAAVNFDGANGVGVLPLQEASKRQLKDKITVNFYNDQIGVGGKLNFRCGADYVKIKQTFPDNVPRQSNAKCVSFDGDADRILYYYEDEVEEFHLMDGDRLAILIAMYLKELLDEANLKVSLGIVQTAYANGNSTIYIKEKLKVDVSCVKTGVKYLHSRALQYDVGIYFEANGHGTTVFGKTFKEKIAEASLTASGKQLEAVKTLLSFVNVTNETIGDAFSDFLIIEAILRVKGWSLQDWKALYDDLPYLQVKVTIMDKNIITTTDAGRKVLTPEKLQEEIDLLVREYKSARCFVRPSGTEDIVRVYAEAATKAEADELALKVSRLVYDMAKGVGKRP